MAGMRDKLVHDYNKVDLTWEVTQSSIPELIEPTALAFAGATTTGVSPRL